MRHVSSITLQREERRVAAQHVREQALVRARRLPSSSAKSRSSETGCRPPCPASSPEEDRHARVAPDAQHDVVVPGESRRCPPHCELRDALQADDDLRRGLGSALPARTRIGTPAQRQFSISSSRATNVSVSESASRPRCRGSRRTGRAPPRAGRRQASRGRRPRGGAGWRRRRRKAAPSRRARAPAAGGSGRRRGSRRRGRRTPAIVDAEGPRPS